MPKSKPGDKSLRQHLKFERDEIPSLVGILGTVIALHVIGWGLFIYYNSDPQYHGLADSKGALVYAGAGALAYSFGLRHAFDADHIAAIDDTTRLMLAKGKKPLGVGLFFSLGHSTVVLALSVLVAFAAQRAARFQEDFAETGGIIGTSVSGLFLYLIGILNLVILVGIIGVWKKAKSGKFSHQHLEELLNDRGLMRRIFRGRFKKGFDKSHQIYPVGVLSLDGIFMTKAYGWAFTSPLRKIYYNITTTSISIFVALVIGTIQIINVLASKTSIDNYEPFTTIANIELSGIGFFIVASFVAAWLLSVLIWRLGKYESRYSSGIVETDHSHTDLKIKD